jgi:cold shock CspA family protein
VGYTGIILYDSASTSTSTSSRDPTPAFFFLADGVASLGSAYRTHCDIELDGMQDSGMSNCALQIELKGKRLQVHCSNRNRFSFQVVKADGARTFLMDGQSCDLFSGDLIAFGRIVAGEGTVGKSFQAIKMIEFHRAPIHIAETISVDAEQDQRSTYAKKEHRSEKRTDRKMKMQAIKAEGRLQKGKHLDRRATLKAERIVKQAQQKPCPYEGKYGRCTGPRCPFKHGPVLTHCEAAQSSVHGTVDRWFADQGYGFAQGASGQRFFLHVSQLAPHQDGDTITLGSDVVFDTRMPRVVGKLHEAVNIVLE